jgi:hypothetical protein
MEMRKIFDAKGVWLVNLAKFSFVDPENGCRFDPQVPTQAPETEWVKAQEAVIKPWIDPTEANEAAEKAAAEAEAKRLADEAAAAEAEAKRLADEAAAAEKAAADAAKKTK